MNDDERGWGEIAIDVVTKVEFMFLATAFVVILIAYVVRC